MEEDWIGAVVRMNAVIIEAEARLSAHVIRLVEIANQGVDTMEAERTLESYRNKLVFLRNLQNKLLQEPEGEK